MVDGQGLRLKLKAFCLFSYKKWPKVKDLRENSPPYLRPPGPPIAGFATDSNDSSVWSISAVRPSVTLVICDHIGWKS